MEKKLSRTLFTFDDEVRDVITNERGIVGSIHYENPTFYTYTVLFAEGPVRMRESQLKLNEKIDF